MDRPILKALLLLILGIILSKYIFISPIIITIILIINLLTCLYNIIKGEINQSLFILFFILGIFLSIVPLDSQLICKEGNTVYVEGIIKNIDDDKIKIRALRVDDINIREENILVYSSDIDNLKLGMKVGFQGKISIPKENTNPKLYNNRLQLKGDKIYTTSYAESIHIINQEIKIRYRIKNTFISRVEDLFENNFTDETQRFLKSVILGKTSYLIDEDLSIYRNLGLGHILAISGMHIGIISIFLLCILKILRVSRRKSLILTLLIIWLYAFLVDYPVSLIRANIMLSFLFYSKIAYEPYDSLDIVLLTMIIILLINPYYLFQIGFQLSFAAVLSIILLAHKIRETFYPYRNFILDSLAILLALQIGMFPIQTYYFNHINLLTILANLLVIPLISKTLLLAFLFIIFNRLFLVSSILKILIEGFMGLQLFIVNSLNNMEILNLSILSFDLIIIIYYYIILLIGFKYINLKRLDKAIIKFICVYLIFLICINLNIYNRDTLKIDFIDVGQGDCILIRENKNTYLVDTGGSPFGSYNIPDSISIPYMKKLGVSRINGFFISHFHEDHCQGFNRVLEEFKVDNIYISYIPEIKDYKESIYKNKDRVYLLKKGDTLNLSENLSINVLWPDENMINYLGENDKSLVLNLNFKGKSLLLTGDIEELPENILKDNLREVDFLKVAHHGSKTSSSEEFLKAARPAYAIIQVGRNNRYNHPNKETIDSLRNMDIKIYRNDMDGLVSLEIRENMYNFKSYLTNGSIQKHRVGMLIYVYRYSILFYLFYYLLICILIKSTYGRERKESIEV